MKMYTQIILLLFGLAAVASHVLKEPDVNPCLQEYKEPTRKFTNGHGFQYLYRRRPLEIVPTAAAKENTTEVTVPTPLAKESTSKVTVTSTTEPVRDVDNVEATKNRRNNMFNAMRERYHSSKNKNSNSPDNSRRKREINNKAIPEAPTLPKLDIQSFPEYVQKMLASRPTFGNKNETVNRKQNSDSLQDHMGKVSSDDTEINENPRTYGMKLSNGQGYSWNHIIDEKNKNTYNDNQHVSEPVHESTESQVANITHENTEQENLSIFDIEVKPSATIKDEKSNKLGENNIQDKPILIVEESKENDNPNNNINDNIKDELNEMFANINGPLSPPENNKLRTYGMSLKGGAANIWNELAGAPNFKIHTTAATTVIDENIENITSTIKIDTTESSNDESLGQNTDLAAGSGHNNEGNNNNEALANQSRLTTAKPKISSKTTLEPKQKVKRFTEDNAVNPKQEIDLRDKMEKSFRQILEKFPPFETITSKPNATTEVEKIDKEPKTYGMNLTGSHGYVWNELIKPGVRYNVGETEMSNTTDQINTESTTSPTTNENASENSYQPSTEITGTETTSEVSTSDEKDINTTYSLDAIEITSESTTAESKPLSTEITNESTTTDSLTTEITSESTTTESNPQTTEEQPQTTESNSQTTREQPQTTEKQPETTSATEQNVKDDKEKTNQEKDNKDKNPVQISLDELLEKDEFWDWLSKWTTTYIDVFNENIEKMVKDEVAKQLKDYMNKNTEINKDSVNNEENNKDEIENDKKPTEIDHGILDNKVNNTDHEINKNKENKDDNKKNAKDKGNSETNIEKEANKLYQKIKQTPLNVKAKSIYGGAVGNDHVTNIFIFNSNGQANKTMQSFLDSLYKNSTSENPVTTSLDEINNDDKDHNSDATTTSATLSEEKEKPDKNDTTTTTSNRTEPSSITSTTINDLAEEDEQDDENNEKATDTSTTESFTIYNEDAIDTKTESTMADQSTETSADDTITEAITSNSTAATTLAINDDVAENVSDINLTVVSLTPNSTDKTESTMAEQSIETAEDDTITKAVTSNSTAATTLAFNDDVEENVSDINSTVVSSTPTSTEATSVNCCNSTNETTTLTSNVIEVNTGEYDCATKEPTELAKLEISIGAKNTDNNNVRKCVRKEKEKPSGVLATLGASLKNPLKRLLNI